MNCYYGAQLCKINKNDHSTRQCFLRKLDSSYKKSKTPNLPCRSKNGSFSVTIWALQRVLNYERKKWKNWRCWIKFSDVYGIFRILDLFLVTPKRLLSLKQGPIERYFFWFYKFFSQGVGLQRESNPRRVLLAAGRRRPGCRRRCLGWRPKSWRRATAPRARRGCLAWRTN